MLSSKLLFGRQCLTTNNRSATEEFNELMDKAVKSERVFSG